MKRRASNEPKWRRYLRFWRRDAVANVSDELEFHFANRVAEFEATGMHARVMRPATSETLMHQN
jgi:hypothetical protein